MNKYLAVEIGGTKQQIAIGTGDGEILYRDAVRLGEKVQARDILQWIREAGQRAIDAAGPIDAAGVGFGGLLESATGRSLCSIQVPGWEDFVLPPWFEETFHVRSVVMNDTVVGGIGELFCGAGVSCEHFFYTNIGTGIGGGLYVGGRYYDGIGFGAAYLGNSWIPDWTSKTPGAATRLELICSGRSIERRLNQPGYVPERSLLAVRLRDGAILNAKELGEAAAAGDAFSREEIERIAGSFSYGLANVLALLAPERIAIGGGVAKLGEPLFDAIRRCTADDAFVTNKGRYEIVPAKLMDDAVLIGGLLAAAGRAEAWQP